MLLILKKRFGYAYIMTTDKHEQNIFSAFCEGKSYLWNLFLGWRKTLYFENGLEHMYFWIPSNKIEVLVLLAKEIKKTA